MFPRNFKRPIGVRDDLLFGVKATTKTPEEFKLVFCIKQTQCETSWARQTGLSQRRALNEPDCWNDVENWENATTYHSHTRLAAMGYVP